MVPDWFLARLGWKPARSAKPRQRCIKEFGVPLGPNLADLSGTSSTLIAGAVYELLGIPKTKVTEFDLGELEDGQDDGDEEEEAKEAEGTRLEKDLEQDLRESLHREEPNRGWYVTRVDPAHEFAQFKHMKALEQILRNDTVRTALEDHPELLNAIARDYRVKTDVMVGLPNHDLSWPEYVLHAAVSSKLTLRSDRAQNVRTEFTSLVRNRRGRLPHLVVVTAEPLPSRLLSLTRGTGEIDANYHLLFDQMDEAMTKLLSDARPRRTHSAIADQERLWREMVDGGRMRPYSTLTATLRRG